MKARVKATGEIVEVEKTILRGVECYINTTGEKRGSIYMEHELDFNVDGKFAENCLNGIKQGVDYNLDYWTLFEHKAAIAAMQGALANANLLFSLCKDRGDCSVKVVAIEFANACAHALVEKYKKEEK